jgi:uncharacterized membrane protein YdbT with pleckstrin-like domain
MDLEKILVRPQLSYFILNKIHIPLLIIACFFLKNIAGLYSVLILGIVLIILLFKFLFDFLEFINISYFITEQQIISERGFFYKKTNYMEMYRIIDYQTKRSLIHIILNLMNVELITMDVTTPILNIRGIKYNSNFVFTIRERDENAKKIQNILELSQF